MMPVKIQRDHPEVQGYLYAAVIINLSTDKKW